MKKYVLKLARIENNSFTAELHITVSNKGVEYSVVSNNYDVKTHLNSFLNDYYYSLVPGTSVGKDYLFLVNLPNTKEHFIYLYDLLSWRGYKVMEIETLQTTEIIKSLMTDSDINAEEEIVLSDNIINELDKKELDSFKVLKSLNFSPRVITKSAGDYSKYIQERNGTKYLVRVPEGFIAVNIKENRVLQGGNYINIPLDDMLTGQSDWVLIPKNQKVFIDKKQVNIAANAQLASTLNEILEDLPDLEKNPEDQEAYKKLQQEAFKALKKFFEEKGGNPRKLKDVLKKIAEATKEYTESTLKRLEETIKEETVDPTASYEFRTLKEKLSEIYAYSPSTGLFTTAFEAARLSLKGNISDWIYINDVLLGENGVDQSHLRKDKEELFKKLLFSIPGIIPNEIVIQFFSQLAKEPKMLENYAIMEYFAARMPDVQIPITLLPLITGQAVKIPDKFMLKPNEVFFANDTSLKKRFGFFIPEPGKFYSIYGELKPQAIMSQGKILGGNKRALVLKGDMLLDSSKMLAGTYLHELIEKAKAQVQHYVDPLVHREISGSVSAGNFMYEVATPSAAQQIIKTIESSQDAQFQKEMFLLFYDQKTGKIVDFPELATRIGAKVKRKINPNNASEIIEAICEHFKIKLHKKIQFKTGFMPKTYQIYGALLAAHPKAFRHTGGLPSKVGMTYFWEAGIGKTITALMAMEIGKATGVYNIDPLQNPDNDDFAKRPFLIFAPKNLMGNWIEDARTVLGYGEVKIGFNPETRQYQVYGDGILRIEGTKSERKEIYEYLLDLHRKGQFPSQIKGIIVGTQKLSKRAGSNVSAIDEIDNTDLKYLLYLSGITSYFNGGKEEKTNKGFFRAIIVDEAGQIMKESAARTANLYSLAARITSDNNRGIAICLNAVSQANTPRDTINILRLNDTAGNFLDKFIDILDSVNGAYTFGFNFLPRLGHLMSELNIDDIVDIRDYREIQHYTSPQELFAVPSTTYPSIAMLMTYIELYNESLRGLSPNSSQGVMVVEYKDANGNKAITKVPAKDLLTRYRTAFISFLHELSYGAIPWNRFMEYGFENIPSLYDYDENMRFDLLTIYNLANKIYQQENPGQPNVKLTKDNPSISKYIRRAEKLLYEKAFHSLVRDIVSNPTEIPQLTESPSELAQVVGIELPKTGQEKPGKQTQGKADTHLDVIPTTPNLISVVQAVAESAYSAIRYLQEIGFDIKQKINSQTFGQEFSNILPVLLDELRFSGIKCGSITLPLLQHAATRGAFSIYLPNFPGELSSQGSLAYEVGDESVESAIGVAEDKEKTGSERKLIIQKRDEMMEYVLTLATLHAAKIITLDTGKTSPNKKPIEISLTARKDRNNVIHGYDLKFIVNLANGQSVSIQDLIPATGDLFRETQEALVKNIEAYIRPTLFRSNSTKETLGAFISALHRLGFKYVPRQATASATPTKGKEKTKPAVGTSTPKIVRTGNTGNTTFRFLGLAGSRRFVDSLDTLFNFFPSSIYKGAIVGGMPYEVQSDLAKAHRESETSIVLGSTDASGRGLNINSDEAFIVADPSFEITEQAKGRPFRLGSYTSPPTLKPKIHMTYPVGVLNILHEKALTGAYTALIKLEKLTELATDNRLKKQYGAYLQKVKELYEDGLKVYAEIRRELYAARVSGHIGDYVLKRKLYPALPIPRKVPQQPQTPKDFFTVTPLNITYAESNIAQQHERYKATTELMNLERHLDNVRKTIRSMHAAAKQSNDAVSKEFARILEQFFFDL